MNTFPEPIPRVKPYRKKPWSVQARAAHAEYWSTENRLAQAARSRRHSLKVDYFTTIDTDEKAYWLGFLTADGCVSYGPRCHRITLSLATEDLGHLQKLRSCLEYTGSIEQYPPTHIKRGAKTHTSQGSVRLSISCLPLVEDLRSHGVVERKTFVARPWEAPSHALQCAWWRGIIDGDGWLTIANRKNGSATPSIGCAGTFDIVNGFMTFVTRDIISIYAKKNHAPWPRGKIYQYHFGGVAQVQQIVRLLYENAIVYLDRKKKIVDRIMQLPTIPVCNLLEVDRQAFIDAKARLRSWNAAARSMNIPIGSLTRLRRLLDC